MLEHHFYITLVGRSVQDRVALDVDVAAARVFEPGDHTHQGCLPASRWSQDRKEGTFGDFEGDVLNGANASEIFGHVQAFKVKFRAHFVLSPSKTAKKRNAATQGCRALLFEEVSASCSGLDLF